MPPARLLQVTVVVDAGDGCGDGISVGERVLVAVGVGVGEALVFREYWVT
jgi:hypothetical protein